MFQIRKTIDCGSIIPPWYGVAWRDFYADRTVCYPIPLNIIASFVRGVIVWLKYGYKAVPVNPRDAYDQGYRDGKLYLKKDL